MSLVPPVSADDRHVASRAVAGLLSMLVPGAGQAFAGAWRRALVLFALFVLAAVPVLVVAAVPFRTAAWLLEGRLLSAALAVNIFLLALRLFAALDAFRMGGLASSVPALTVAGAIAAVTATPHVAAGYVAVWSWARAGASGDLVPDERGMARCPSAAPPAPQPVRRFRLHSHGSKGCAYGLQ